MESKSLTQPGVAVDLWSVELDHDLDDESSVVLSAREWPRAHALWSERARHRRVSGRLQLRQIASGYCAVEAAQLPVDETTDGKPYLHQPFSTLDFSFSHSGGAGLLAVCRGARLGVDIEQRPTPLRALNDLLYWLHND